MAQFGKNRFPKGYQSGVGYKNPNAIRGDKDHFHKNSKELVQILKSNNVELKSKVFELGSGPARNLHYILKEYPDVKLYCNDLYPSSINHMSDEVKEIVNYYVGDSEDIINDKKIQKEIIDNLDLFLVSDHFMHLEYEKANSIINKVLSTWKPKYIMLREIKEEHEAPNHPRLFHNYYKFLKDYNLIHESTSVNADEYFIWLLEVK